MAAVASIASQLTGRPIRRVVVGDAQYRDTGPTLARLLGRPAIPLVSVLREHLKENAG